MQTLYSTQAFNNVVQKLAQYASVQQMQAAMQQHVTEEGLLYVSDDTAEELIDEALHAQKQLQLF